MVGPSWQRLIWDLLQYSPVLSLYRTAVLLDIRRWVKKVTQKDSTNNWLKNVEVDIMQWAPDGLAWWSLACALVPTLIPRLPSLSLSLSLSAHHTLRPVTLGRWPLSGQSQTGQASPDTAAEQSPTIRGHFVQSALLPLFLPSHNASQPSSAMAHFGHSQATVRKHNHQANLFWSLYTT